MINVIRKNRNIHFVGIGGAGMSGLAILLHKLGFKVSGSDKVSSSATRDLKAMGIRVTHRHSRKNIAGADLVVYSSAVPLQSPELKAAWDAQIPVMRRADMLGEIMRMNFSIAVAGTHGKTTTTSMVGTVFNSAGLSPTLIVGGIVRNINTNALLGRNNYAIIEADEFDRSFLAMSPSVAIVTTLDADHLDCYGTFEEIKKAFVEFCNKVPFYGCVICCMDDPSVLEIIPKIRKQVITYGLVQQADYSVRHLVNEGGKASFTVVRHGKTLGEFALPVPGIHNTRNALAAITVAFELGIPVTQIADGLGHFGGVRRRFESKGKGRKIEVIDDYAHHPTEVRATLEAAAELGRKRIVAVFQPHLYSRTRDLCGDFAHAFLAADVLVVTDVYPAREKPIPGVSGKNIVDAAKACGHKNARYVADKREVPRALKRIVKAGDLVLTMGAGDIWKYGEMFLKGLA